MSYFSISSKTANELTIVCTPDIRDHLIAQFNCIVDMRLARHSVVSNDNFAFLCQYQVPLDDEIIEQMFERCKTFLREHISNSFVNSPN